MKKELTPLEALKELTDIAFDRVRSGWRDTKLERHILDLGNIIETALKRLEIIDRLNEKHCEDTQNKLKALEIIKEKATDILELKIAIQLNDLNEYNKRHADWCKLSQAEFDLLKEVFK